MSNQYPGDEAGPARSRRFDRIVTSGPGLEITLDFSAALLIGRLAGHLQAHARPQLRQTLRSALGQCPERVLIDAAALISCDAAGLTVLVEALDVGPELPIGVSGLSPVYRRMLRVVATGHGQHIRTFSTLREATDYLLAVPGAARPDAETLLGEVRHLHRAMLTRSTIEQAKGVLMAVYGLDDEAAFSMLAWYSRSANVPLRELASRLLTVLRGELTGQLSMARMDALLADLAQPEPEAGETSA